MKVKEIVWKRQVSRYSSGEDAMIGTIKVGSWQWNGIDRDDSIRYLAFCQLPTIPDRKRGFPTEAEAKTEVERLVRLWFEQVTE